LNVPEMASAVIDGSPDVTLIPGWYSATLVRAAFACRLKGIPVICRSDMQLGRITDSVRAAAWEMKTRTMLRFFTHFLSVGRRHTEYLERFGISRDRIFFSPHCVDNDFFARSAGPYHEKARREEARGQLGIPAGDFVVLYVGKLANKKRPWDAVLACAALGPDVTLLIVGSGEAEERCREAARESGANAMFTGFFNQSELGRAYALADCLVLPSDYGETWGLVVNEAMATGLPCVVSDAVGCAPDLIIPGRTGYTYPLGRVDALSTALDSLRAQLRAGHSFSTDCREHIAGYSFEKATEGLSSACQAAVNVRPDATAATRG
jgi:glycosyltransferase involved in cell wall biosynthesis